MIDSDGLLADSVNLVKDLVEDLRGVCEADASENESLEVQWQEARDAGRTAVAFAEWREDRLTQVAVAWVLSCVFVRFCEDNDLIDVSLSGPGDRLQRARDRYTTFVAANPAEDQRTYLRNEFTKMRSLSATERLYGQHNLVWALSPSAVGSKELLEFWWQLNDETGELAHNFTDPTWDTRFLGDLYQDVSEDVRKKYALLQTPEFVESFILDRTLDPAIDEFGLAETDLIDPACGSGHFLLGAFDRLFTRWKQQEPTANPIGLAERALAQVAGVDLNPYAVAIARFRLLVAALRVCGVTKLADAPDFGVRVAVGDSLLHGRGVQQAFDADGLEASIAHLYSTEDEDLVESILSKTYAAVVANPPYIQGKDKAARAAYKERYPACHGKWAMSVPFFQRIFGLSHRASTDRSAGFVGQITANSFMKREFGKKLVENFLPTWDLTSLIDTSGAYLPGHGTPTIIVFGRNQNPTTDKVRAVFGLRGEPSTPEDPAKGLVWSAIESQADDADSTTEYVRSIDWPRSRVHSHPMVFGGGADLWFRVDTAPSTRLGSVAESIGFHAISGEDPVFLEWPPSIVGRRSDFQGRTFVPGTSVRDWAVSANELALFPYNEDLGPELLAGPGQILWPYRTSIAAGLMFGKTRADRGMEWFEFVSFSHKRDRVPLSIAFAFVATHNHFVLDRGGKVFKQSAPVIKLPADATEDDHFELLGPLNSSLGCFWMKQVSHNKGSTVDQHGARQTTVDFENFFEFTGTQLKSFPLVDFAPTTARKLDEVAGQTERLFECELAWDTERLTDTKSQLEDSRQAMVGLQEELDWAVMAACGICPDGLVPDNPLEQPLLLGERAFEIAMARTGVESTWFDRHGSTPITELPSHWSAEYRDLVARRIAAIEADPAGVGFIERPEFKRRWNWEPWDEIEERLLRSWLVDAIEGLDVWRDASAVSAARVSDLAQSEVEGFADVAALYAGADVSVLNLVSDLLTDEAVPHVAGLRLKPSGMRKRAIWERTWELQRAEDAIDARSELDPADPNYLTAEAATALKAEEVLSLIHI